MSNHAHEPWATEYRERHDGMYSQEIFDLSGETIAQLAWYPIKLKTGVGTNREENARRIVACVNACAGVSTEYLEHTRISAITKFASKADEDWFDIKQERDELLAALETSHTVACVLMSRFSSVGMLQEWNQANEMAEKIERAIAQAKGV